MQPLLRRLGFAVRITAWGLLAAAGMGAAAWAQNADIKTIAHGDRVDLKSHLVDGKFTLFSFYADWCGGCRALAPKLDALAARQSARLSLRKIDIRRWGSPVAEQFRLRSIPHLKAYDPSGALIAEGQPGGVLSKLSKQLSSASADASGASAAVGAQKAGRANRSLEDGGEKAGSYRATAALVVFLIAALGTAALVTRRRSARVTPPEAGTAPEPIVSAVGTHGVRPSSVRLWSVKIEDAVQGPFSLEQLDEIRRRMHLADDVLVKCKGQVTWRRLGDVLSAKP